MTVILYSFVILFITFIYSTLRISSIESISEEEKNY